MIYPKRESQGDHRRQKKRNFGRLMGSINEGVFAKAKCLVGETHGLKGVWR